MREEYTAVIGTMWVKKTSKAAASKEVASSMRDLPDTAALYHMRAAKKSQLVRLNTQLRQLKTDIATADALCAESEQRLYENYISTLDKRL